MESAAIETRETMLSAHPDVSPPRGHRDHSSNVTPVGGGQVPYRILLHDFNLTVRIPQPDATTTVGSQAYRGFSVATPLAIGQAEHTGTHDRHPQRTRPILGDGLNTRAALLDQILDGQRDRDPSLPFRVPDPLW